MNIRRRQEKKEQCKEFQVWKDKGDNICIVKLHRDEITRSLRCPSLVTLKAISSGKKINLKSISEDAFPKFINHPERRVAISSQRKEDHRKPKMVRNQKSFCTLFYFSTKHCNDTCCDLFNDWPRMFVRLNWKKTSKSKLRTFPYLGKDWWRDSRQTWFVVRNLKVPEKLGEFQETGSPSMQGTFLSLFTRRSHKDRGDALAWWETSFRGPMPFITWRDVDLFTDRSYENEGRKGKARCETACFEQSSAFTKIYLCLSSSFCKRTLCSPVSLWSSSGHVYTSVLIPNRSREAAACSGTEKKKSKACKCSGLLCSLTDVSCGVIFLLTTCSNICSNIRRWQERRRDFSIGHAWLHRSSCFCGLVI